MYCHFSLYLKKRANIHAGKVNYAAKRGIKLLVKNTSHGFAKSVRSVVNGIQISVQQMNNISLDLENNVATLGGGVIVAEFIDALWKAGKRTGLIFIPLVYGES
jgi:FAD/FMN-containing dehydrogenase